MLYIAFLQCPDLKEKKIDIPTPTILRPKGQTNLDFFRPYIHFIVLAAKDQLVVENVSREGHSNGKSGYQARPWTHKKDPNHIFFRYENRP